MKFNPQPAAPHHLASPVLLSLDVIPSPRYHVKTTQHLEHIAHRHVFSRNRYMPWHRDHTCGVAADGAFQLPSSSAAHCSLFGDTPLLPTPFGFIDYSGRLDSRYSVCTLQKSSRRRCVGAFAHLAMAACSPSLAGSTAKRSVHIAPLLPILIGQLCCILIAATSSFLLRHQRTSFTIFVIPSMPSSQSLQPTASRLTAQFSDD